MASKFNKTDDPLRSLVELADQVNWDDYDRKGDFSYLCTLKADREKEKLYITDEVMQHMKLSCVYIMVINGKIFKIGAALRGFRSRLGSYNTGKTKYRTRGTNSSTNFWVLQSFINLDEPVKVYAIYPKMKSCIVLDQKIQEPFPSANLFSPIRR